jgi:hypothetical protein
MAETYNGNYVDQTRTLEASATHTATGSPTSGVYLPAPKNGLAFVLDVTAAATNIADALSVYVQTQIGSEWHDVVRFTTILGDGGALTYIHKIAGVLTTAEYETGTGLIAAADRDFCGDAWRVRRVVINTVAPSFTYSVVACPF